MNHYRIPETTDNEEVIVFASKKALDAAIGELVTRLADTQQTIIDYDKNQECFVIRFVAKKYGDMVQEPQLSNAYRDLERGSEKRLFILGTGKKLPELM